MTDSDDKLSRRYRELPREEPGEDLDSAILAASRRAVGAGPRARRSSWMVPTSIAAVLVLGIGVSLRMQMEQPGVETSVPSSPSAEYPVPQATEPTPSPKLTAPAPEAAVAPVPKAAPRQERARADLAEREVAKPLAKDAAQATPAPASPPAVATTAAGAPAPRPQAAPALRAKREATAGNAIADADPARELERIARLRESAHHEEADRALKEFQRRHPDYRIPEAMWERVKPR